ncbi:hypothetical protein MMIN_36260 [Mycolicibacter minnesotensis]|nr:hypothetical protein MMIN_36260 [Mycolicibacter minnesotensis]
MTRVMQASGSQRRKRIRWSKALLAVAPAALFIAAPAPAHADGACTALANEVAAYNACMNKMNMHCAYTGGFYVEVHSTCTYADGGRDECVQHLVPFSFGGVEVTDSTCTYVPPGVP